MIDPARKAYVVTRKMIAEAKNAGQSPEQFCAGLGLPYLPGGGWIFASAQVYGDLRRLAEKLAAREVSGASSS